MEKSERRQSLLVHAKEVFARRGFHSSTVEDIVRAAGVARVTFYMHFEDKRAVFEEIVDRFLAKIAMAILRVDTSEGIGPQIRENIERLVDVFLEDRATSRILLTGAVGIDPGFDRKLRTFYDELVKLLSQSLSEGQTLHLVETQITTKTLSYAVLGALKEVTFQLVTGELQREDVVNSLEALFQKGFLRIPT